MQLLQLPAPSIHLIRPGRGRIVCFRRRRCATTVCGLDNNSAQQLLVPYAGPIALPVFQSSSLLLPTASGVLRAYEPRYLQLFADLRKRHGGRLEGAVFGHFLSPAAAPHALLTDKEFGVSQAFPFPRLGVAATIIRAEPHPCGDGSLVVHYEGGRRMRLLSLWQHQPYYMGAACDFCDDHAERSPGDLEQIDAQEGLLWGMLQEVARLTARLSDTSATAHSSSPPSSPVDSTPHTPNTWRPSTSCQSAPHHQFSDGSSSTERSEEILGLNPSDPNEHRHSLDETPAHRAQAQQQQQQPGGERRLGQLPQPLMRYAPPAGAGRPGRGASSSSADYLVDIGHPAGMAIATWRRSSSSQSVARSHRSAGRQLSDPYQAVQEQAAKDVRQTLFSFAASGMVEIGLPEALALLMSRDTAARMAWLSHAVEPYLKELRVKVSIAKALG